MKAPSLQLVVTLTEDPKICFLSPAIQTVSAAPMWRRSLQPPIIVHILIAQGWTKDLRRPPFRWLSSSINCKPFCGSPKLATMSDLNGILPLIRESNTTNVTVTWQPKAGLNGVERLTKIAFHDGEIIPNLAFHACNESCQHEDIQKLVERSEEKASGSESSDVTTALKIWPDGNWERRQHEEIASESRIGRLTYDQLLYKPPEVELFNAGRQKTGKSPVIPTIPPSQICDICTHFGFGMICGGVLVLKGECQSDEDRARWAWEAHDRKGFEEQAIQPNYASLAESASNCASCRLFHACLADPTSYTIDESRPVTIRAGLAINKDQQRDISHLKVGLPIIDPNYPGEAVSVYGQVEIYTSHSIVKVSQRGSQF